MSILKSFLHGNRDFNLGAIIACHLERNLVSGEIYGGINVTRIAAHLGVPISNDDYELPTSFLDFQAMQFHQFIEYGTKNYKYKLIFDKYRSPTITLHALVCFNFQEKHRGILSLRRKPT